MDPGLAHTPEPSLSLHVAPSHPALSHTLSLLPPTLVLPQALTSLLSFSGLEDAFLSQRGLCPSASPSLHLVGPVGPGCSLWAVLLC